MYYNRVMYSKVNTNTDKTSNAETWQWFVACNKVICDGDGMSATATSPINRHLSSSILDHFNIFFMS
jgi:hypothetical protein